MKPIEYYRQWKLKNTDSVKSNFDDMIDFCESYHEYMMGKYFNENSVENMRDRFAMSAMKNVDMGVDQFDDSNINFANCCYNIADAMMERRKKK